jgi:hypothetical protein
MGDVIYYATFHHEAASKFIGQGGFAAKYSAGAPVERLSTYPSRSG